MASHNNYHLKAGRVALLGILLSMALILGIVDNWIPIPMLIPGMKLGLSNVVILFAVYRLKSYETLILIILKCILGAMFAGGMIGFIFSITGGILSGIIMFVMAKLFKELFSLEVVSIAGAFSHNLGQVIAAVIIYQTKAVILSYTWLGVLSIITGLTVGIIAKLILKYTAKIKL